MATVKYDITSKDTITCTKDGYSISATAIVTGLTTLTPVGRVSEAITALGIFIGQPHATFTNSFLQAWSSESLHNNVVQITMQFEPMLNVPDEISITGSTQEVETNFDVNDTAIEVSYTYPAGFPDPLKAGSTETVSKTIQKSVPSQTLVMRTRAVISGEELGDLQATYVGKVNAEDWNLRPDDLPGKWLCSDISGDRVGTIAVLESLVWVIYFVYDVTMTFNSHPDNWNSTEVVFTLDSGDVPDPDTWTAGVTQKTVELYDEIDFSTITAV